MLSIESFDTKNTELFKKALDIRIEVFVKEQGVDFDLEEDEFENQCIHYLVFENNEAIATARSRETEKGMKLERIALLKSCRGKNIGSFLLNHLIEIHKSKNQTIYLHAQIVAKRFYEKHGFKITSQPFIEDGIKHVVMSLML